MSRVLPILFNTEMVRAILEDRKTATRRILKLPKHIKKQENGLYTLFTEGTCYENQHMEEIVNYIKPPYQPGDILYVRETWNFVYDMDDNDQIVEGTRRYVYYVDDSMPFSYWVDPDTGEHKDNMSWKPSIHMPKDAARIWLRVTDVRVERLQDITEEQAAAEGALKCYEVVRPDEREPVIYQAEDGGGYFVIGFKAVWDSTLNKTDREVYSWDANPGVWVIEFERCEKPEEARDK